MNKKSRIMLIILLVLLLLLLGYFFLNSQKRVNDIDKSLTHRPADNTKQTTNEDKYVLKDYPLKEVPLLKSTKISSMKYFVNDDTNSVSNFFGTPLNYYNVVFDSEATQPEVISYYRSLMSEINEEGSDETKVEGRISKYKVSASHYGESTKTVYLQVHLPADNYAKENPYYQEYPQIIDIDVSWMEKENSYGKLNQSNGQEEFTHYYNLNLDNLKERFNDEMDVDDTDFFKYFYDEYKQKYQTKEGFTANDKEQMLMWKDSGNSVTLSFKTSHSRVYLMIRRGLK